MEEIGLRAVLGTTDFDKGLDKYLGGIARMDRETKSVIVSVSGGVDAIGQSFTRVGTILTTAVVAGAAAATAALGGVIKGGVALAADLEEQMSGVGAITQGTVEDVADLRSLALDLGVDPNLKVSALDAASAMEVLAKNGLTADQILDGAARSSVTLANATGTNLSNAADIATDAMVLFGIEASNMVAAVDGITSVVTSSKFDIDDYRLGLGQAGSQFNALGFDIDDFNVAMAATSANFTGGAQAGTGLRNFLLRLAPTTKTAKEEMERLGLITDEAGNRFFDAEGNTRSLAEISGVLQDALINLSDEQRSTALRIVFGNDAMGAAIGLSRVGAEGFNELAARMAQVDAGEQVARRVDNLNSAFEIMRSVIENVGIRIGDRFLPLIRELTVAFTELVAQNEGRIVDFFGVIADRMSQMIQRGEELADRFGPQIRSMLPALAGFAAAFGAIAVAAGPALIIVGQLISVGANIAGLVGTIAPVIASMGGLTAALGTAKIAAGAFLGSIIPVAGPIIAVVAAVAGLGVALATNFGGLRDLASAIFGNFLEPLGVVVDFIRGTVMPTIRTIVSSGFSILDSVIRSVGQAAGQVLVPVFSAVSGVLTPVFQIATSVAGVFFNQLGRSFQFVARVVRFLSPIVGTLVGLFLRWNPITVAVITGLQLLGRILRFVVNVGTQVATSLRQRLAPTFQRISDIVENVANKMRIARDALIAVGHAVGLVEFDNFNIAGDAVAETAAAVADEFGGMDEAVAESAERQSEFTDATDDLLDTNDDLLGSLGDMEGGFEDVGGAVQSASEAYSDYFKAATEAEDKTIDLNAVVIKGVTGNERYIDSVEDIVNVHGDLSDAEIKAAQLAAELQVKRDELLESYTDEGKAITGVGEELEDLFGARVRQVNAMLEQEKAEAKLQELFEERVEKNAERHTELMGEVAGAYANVLTSQKDLAANPIDEQLQEQAANAAGALEAAFGSVRDNYASFVFDLAQITQGAFTEESAQLAIGLGTLTIDEAEAKLIEQQIKDSLAPLQQQELAIALGVAVQDGEVVREDIDRLFNQVKEAAEQGFSDVVDGVIRTSITLAEEDGEIDTSEIVALIQATDIAAAAGGAIPVDVAMDLSARLNEGQARGLTATFDEIRESVTNEADQQRAIDLAIDLLLSGNVDEAELQETFGRIRETIETEGATFDEAIEILVQAEADTAQAEMDVAGLVQLVDESTGKVIEIDANAEQAVGTFAIVQGSLTRLDNETVTPMVDVEVDRVAFDTLTQNVDEFGNIDISARASVETDSTPLTQLEQELQQVHTTPTIAEAEVTVVGDLEALKRIGDVEIALTDATDVAYEAEVNISFSGDDELITFADNLTETTNATTSALQTTWVDTSTGITTSQQQMWTTLGEQHATSAESHQINWQAHNDAIIAGRVGMWQTILENHTIYSAQLETAQETMFLNLTTGANVGMAGIVTEVGTGMSNFLLAVSSSQPEIVAAHLSIVTASINAMRGQRGSYDATGAFLADGIEAGIRSRIGAIAAAAAEAVSAAIAAANAAGQVESPSKLTTKTGEFLGDGYIVGMGNRVGAAKSAAERIVGSMIDSAEKAMVERMRSIQRTRSIPSSFSTPATASALSPSGFAPVSLPSFLGSRSTSTSSTHIVNHIDQSTSVNVDAKYNNPQSPVRLRHDIEAVLAFR